MWVGQAVPGNSNGLSWLPVIDYSFSFPDSDRNFLSFPNFIHLDVTFLHSHASPLV
jgi:hypothetical protein